MSKFPIDEKEVMKMEHPEKLNKILADFNEIKAAYLFGSYADGQPTSNSDIDIGILFDEGFNRLKKLDILTTLTQNGFDNVDLVILNNASLLVKYEVVKRNKLIYCRTDFDPSAYFSRIIRLFLDFKPYLEVQRMYLKERIING